MFHALVCKSLKVILIGMFALVVGCAALPKNETTTETDNQSVEKAKAAITSGDNAWRAGDLDRALVEYVTALGFDSANAEALYKIASIHAAQNNQAKAETAFRQVLAQKGDDAKALEGLGLVLLKQRRHQEAEAMLSKAIALEPRLWRAQNGLGVIYDLSGNHQRAQDHYGVARRERPDSPLVLNNLGYSNYLSRRWTQAQIYFEQALAKDPKNKNAWSNLGLMYARQDQYDKAMQAFQQIMDEPHAANTVGYLCMADGKYDDAERFFVEAIRLSPSYYAAAQTNLSLVRGKNRQGVTASTSAGAQLSPWALE